MVDNNYVLTTMNLQYLHTLSLTEESHRGLHITVSLSLSLSNRASLPLHLQCSSLYFPLYSSVSLCVHQFFSRFFLSLSLLPSVSIVISLSISLYLSICLSICYPFFFLSLAVSLSLSLTHTYRLLELLVIHEEFCTSGQSLWGRVRAKILRIVRTRSKLE